MPRLSVLDTVRGLSATSSKYAEQTHFIPAVRNMLSEKDLESVLGEGAALSTEEPIAYAQHGRGKRKHPTSGWAH